MSDTEDRVSDLERKVNTLQSDRDTMARIVIKLCDLVEAQGVRFTVLTQARDEAETMLLPYRD